MFSARLGVSAREKMPDFLLSRSLTDPQWDAFLASTPAGQFEQTSAWAKAKSIYGWRPIRLTVHQDGQLLGGAQILCRRLPLFGKIGYVSKGPVLGPSCQPEMVHRLLSDLHRIARQERILFLLAQPPDDGHALEGLLSNSGFRVDDTVGMITATTKIDLRPDVDAIFKNMESSNRKFIRRGQRAGVQVREGARGDIDLFFHLMSQSCRHQGVAPNPSVPDFIRALWGAFEPSGHVKLLFAEYKGAIVSGLFLIPFGDTVRAWKMGWSGGHPEVRPNQFLHWEAMQWAKNAGYSYFDFLGINRRIAEAILAGEGLYDVADGPAIFKLMFGGEVVLLPRAYACIPNPVLRSLHGAYIQHPRIADRLRRVVSRIVELPKKFSSRISHDRPVMCASEGGRRSSNAAGECTGGKTIEAAL
jgi:peptidoglycan pentaglycine glycine transferase (the first glycine)